MVVVLVILADLPAKILPKTTTTQTYEQLLEFKKSQPRITITQEIDINGNNVNENFTLETGILEINEETKQVWKSPEEWWIDSFALADSNNDGNLELNISLWKAGNYGSSKPFWVTENDMSAKNHFFVYRFEGNQPKALWHSSNLDAPNCKFQFVDADKDDKLELQVIEGDYADWPYCKGYYLATWKWNRWGFANESRSKKGSFTDFTYQD